MNKGLSTGVLKWMLFVFALSSALSSYAQDEDIITHISTALRSGSSKELVKYVNTSVEINLDGKISSYSKMQAEYVFKDFFKQNPASKFNFNHQGTSKGGLRYAIGKYEYKDGSYMVWLRIKEFNGQLLIYEMNFIKE